MTTPRIFDRRTSGLLCPVSALPSPYGIGTLGEAAYRFVDFLCEAGQRVWQVLPVGPSGYGDSPYQSFYDGAGNPYFIDPDRLVHDGLLEPEAVAAHVRENDGTVDYGDLWRYRRPLLRTAYERFCAKAGPAALNDFADFKAGRDDLRWYALFMAAKKDTGGLARCAFPLPLRRREPEAVRDLARRAAVEIDVILFAQYLFHRQWRALKAYAAERGIVLFGDLPIYVADDSLDVWRFPAWFQLDDELKPTRVAGCPPDFFSADGQLWGNPLYDWGRMNADGYAWWAKRLERALAMYDLLRLDHFRGFADYWSVPAEAPTAASGCWCEGPGLAFFDAMSRRLGADLPFVAENLGALTQEARDLFDACAYPGMNVMQFAFDPKTPSEHLPHRLSRHTVYYAGTHDNDTLAGWIASAPPEVLDFARRYLGLSHEERYVHGMMRGMATSCARMVIYQVQDLLELGSEARMNYPGRSEGNWRWRFKSGELTAEMAASLAELMRISERNDG